MKKLSLSFLALLVVLLGTCFVGCKKDVNFVDTPGLVNSDGNSSGVDADSATITKDGNSSGVDADSATITKDGNSSGVDADSTTVTKDGTEYSISLESVAADHKIAVIKAVRGITGLGLKAAKELVEGAPKVLKKGISKEEADKIKQEIEAAGGVVNIYTSVQGNL